MLSACDVAQELRMFYPPGFYITTARFFGAVIDPVISITVSLLADNDKALKNAVATVVRPFWV